MNTKSLQILSRISFFMGIIIGLALSVIAIWNNLEATSYYFRGTKYAQFHGLQCPLMIAPTEKGIVTAVFKSPSDKEDTFFYRAEISGRASFTRQIADKISVPPNEAKSIRITVDANDVDLRFFVLTKLTISPNSIHPSQEAVCGIMVVNLLGLTGTQISIAALLLSLLGIGTGLVLWQPTDRKSDRTMQSIARALGVIVVLAMFAAFMEWWMAAIAFSVIAILLMVISLHSVVP
jgi:hypothetical protein